MLNMQAISTFFGSLFLLLLSWNTNALGEDEFVALQKNNLLGQSLSQQTLKRLRKEGASVEWLMEQKNVNWQDLLMHLPFVFSTDDLRSPSNFRFSTFVVSKNKKGAWSDVDRFLLEKMEDKVGVLKKDFWGKIKELVCDHKKVIFPNNSQGPIRTESDFHFSFQGKEALHKTLLICSENFKRSEVSFELPKLLEQVSDELPSIIEIKSEFRVINLNFENGNFIQIGFRPPFLAMKNGTFLSKILIRTSNKAIIFECFEAGIDETKVIPHNSIEDFVRAIEQKKSDLAEHLPSFDYTRRFWREMQSHFPEPRKPLSPVVIKELCEYIKESQNEKLSYKQRRVLMGIISLRLKSIQDTFVTKHGNYIPYSSNDRSMREALIEEKVGPLFGLIISKYLIQSSIEKIMSPKERLTYRIVSFTAGYPAPGITKGEKKMGKMIYESPLLIQSLNQVFECKELPQESVDKLHNIFHQNDPIKSSIAIQLLAVTQNMDRITTTEIQQLLTNLELKNSELIPCTALSLIDSLLDFPSGRKIMRSIVDTEVSGDEKQKMIICQSFYVRAYSCILCQEFSSYDEDEANKDLKWCVRVLQENKKVK